MRNAFCSRDRVELHRAGWVTYIIIMLEIKSHRQCSSVVFELHAETVSVYPELDQAVSLATGGLGHVGWD
jgi:hypothetical protein